MTESTPINVDSSDQADKQCMVPASTLSMFQPGDALGDKRASAIEDAHLQAARQEPGSVREKLYALQAATGELPEVDCPLHHVFAPGAYARTIYIPKGTVVVGKIHKHQHLNVLSQGVVSVLTETGGVERFTGPLTMVSPPGTKRAVYAETDVVWTTIHLTNETDLGRIEDEVIAKTYEEYEQFSLTQPRTERIEVHP